MELHTLKVLILTLRGIIRPTNDHLQSTDLERVLLMVSILQFQPSQAIMGIHKGHQEQHLPELALLTLALVVVVLLRAPYHPRAIQVVQVQAGHGQGQGLSVKAVTLSTHL